MKPVKLTISGFGPYSNTAEIDFSKLGDGKGIGLYLIAGNTGSGKTSIFDAISYALYGEDSGRKLPGRMLRSDFAENDTKTFVRFVFEYGNKTYTIERQPEYERQKKRGKGFIKSPSSADITMPDGNVISGMSPVTNKVEEILGINRQQFTQIVMIAQGDFLKFLQSGTKEKSAILRNIFDTKKFFDFQDELKAKTKSLEESFNDEIKSLKQYADGIVVYGEVSENIKEWLAEKNIHKLPELIKYLKEFIASEEISLNTKKEYLSEINKDLHNCIEEITKGTLNNKLFDELADKKKTIPTYEQNDILYAKKKEDLNAGLNALRKVKPLYDRYCDAYTEYIKLKNEIDKMSAEEPSITSNLEKLKSNFESVRQNDEKIMLLQSEIKTLSEQMPNYERHSVLKNELIKLSAEISKLTENQESSQRLKDEKTSLLKRTETELSELKNSTAELLNAENAYKKETEKLNDLIRLEASLKDLKKHKNTLKSVSESYKASKEKSAKLQNEETVLEIAFLSEQAAILAATLSRGIPCPVCGSLEHPKPTSPSKKAPLESEVKAAKAKSEEARKEEGNLRSRYEVGCSRTKNLEEQCIRDAHKYMKCTPEDMWHKVPNEIESVRNKLETLTKDLAHCKSKVNRENELNKTLTKIKEDIIALDSKIAKTTADLNESKFVCSAKTGAYESLTAQLLYKTPNAATAALKDKKLLLSELSKNLENADKALKKATEEFKEFKAVLNEKMISLEKKHEDTKARFNHFNSALSDSGLTNIDAYKTVLITEEKAAAVEKEIAEYENQKEQLVRDIIRLEKETKNKHYTNIEEIKSKQAELEKTHKYEIENSSDMQTRLETNKRILKNIIEKQQAIQMAEKEYLNYKALSDTANGDISGKARITFETFVQVAYFSRILSAANQRLRVMSSGKYVLERRQESTDLRSHMGLELNVFDNHTGKSRDIKSLSGGESFIASLSLALGLSDVVQQTSGGVKLQSMFIDEGFGSLDPDSLDTAILTLQNLSGNRNIAIISHVTELRTRINKQILVKNSTSGSKIEIKNL